MQPDSITAEGVRTALICSGKVYYDLVARREKEGRTEVAILRLEQLYPFPKDQLEEALRGYPDLTEVRWVQEEPKNLATQAFVHSWVGSALPEGVSLTHISRDESASPATGSATLHQIEQEELISRSFEAPA